jgi:hypothetical protein
MSVDINTSPSGDLNILPESSSGKFESKSRNSSVVDENPLPIEEASIVSGATTVGSQKSISNVSTNRKSSNSSASAVDQSANYYAVPRMAFTTTTNPPSPRPGLSLASPDLANGSTTGSAQGLALGSASMPGSSTTSSKKFQIGPHNSTLNPISNHQLRVTAHGQQLRENLGIQPSGSEGSKHPHPPSLITNAAVVRGTSISTLDSRDSLASTLSVKSLVQFYSSKSLPSSPIMSSRRASVEGVGFIEPIKTLSSRSNPNLTQQRMKKSRINENSEIAKKYIEAAKLKLAEEQRLLLEEKAAAEARLQAFRKSMEESKNQRKNSNTSSSDALHVLEEKPHGEISLQIAKKLLEEEGTTKKAAAKVSSRKLSHESTNQTNQSPRSPSPSQRPSRSSSQPQSQEKPQSSRNPSRAQSEVASTRSVYSTRSRNSSISTTFSTEDAMRLEKDRLKANLAVVRERLAKQRSEIMLQEQEKKRLQAIKAFKEQQRAASREAVRIAREKRLAIETARIQRERRASSQMQIIPLRTPTQVINDQRWQKIVNDRLVASEASKKKTDEIQEEFTKKSSKKSSR